MSKTKQNTVPSRQEPSSDILVQTIFDYIGQIAKERDFDRLLVLLADMGRDLISADRCTVWLIDREEKELWTRVAHGLDRIRIPMTAGIAGYVARSGDSVIINDPYNDERFDKEVDRKSGYKTCNILALPIVDSQGSILGVFQALNKMTSIGYFNDSDLNHLLLAASYTGKQLEAVLLQDEIEKTQKEIIFTLAETGEMRSKETGNHVKRVAEYTRLLGTECGMSRDEAELLKLASPLHDIGKIAIPDAVLLKPDKLTDDEWIIMQTHAILGYDMLKHSERRILAAAAIVAHEHHEKWNGTGYPRALSGNDIHMYGRITAIADVFDALASDRVYKKAWPMDRIIDLFKAERGVHFDPDLVDTFLANFDGFQHIRQMYRDEPGDEKKQ